MQRYQRGRLLGKGSFGAAYLVTERATSKQFVLKEISLARMQPEERNAAKQEAEVCVTPRHAQLHASDATTMLQAMLEKD